MSNFPHTRFNHLKCCWLVKVIANHSLNCHERVAFCPFCGNSDAGIHQFPGRLQYRHRGCSQMIQKHRGNPTCSESSEEVWLRLDRIGIQSIALWSVGRSDQQSASERQSKYLGKKNCWWESMSFAPCSCKTVFLPTSLLCVWTTAVPHLLLQTLAERCHWPFCRKTSLAHTKMIHWIFKTRRIEECDVCALMCVPEHTCAKTLTIFKVLVNMMGLDYVSDMKQYRGLAFFHAQTLVKGYKALWYKNQVCTKKTLPVCSLYTKEILLFNTIALGLLQ